MAGFAGSSYEGFVLTFDVAESAVETYSDTIPLDCTKVVKKGLGTLTMSGNSVNFHGDVEIREGVVVATHMNALGRGTGSTGVSTLNTISVSKGAQLRATFLSDKSDNSEGRGFRSVVKIAGDGPDGSGAFYYDPTDASTLPYWLIYKLVLTDDASIGGTANYFARSLDMNSKTLTVDMKSMLHFYWTIAIDNPGNIITKVEPKFHGTSAKRFKGSADNKLIVKDTAAKMHFSGGYPIDWSVFWERLFSGTIEVPSSGADGSRNAINGNFDFMGTALTIWPQANCGVSFNGNFAVAGDITTGGAGTIFWKGLTNSMKSVSFTSGKAVVAGADSFVASRLIMDGGAEVAFDNVKSVMMTNSTSALRSRVSVGHKPARLSLKGDTSFSVLDATAYLHAGLYTEYNSTIGKEPTWGVFSLEDGCSVSNNISVGYSGMGALYQYGGEVWWAVTERKNSGYIGCGQDGGYGYYGMSGGKLTVPRFWVMAGDSTNSTAFYVQKGGVAVLKGEDLKLSTKGRAHFYVGNGAKFTQEAGSTYMGYAADGSSDLANGEAVLTVDGEGSEISSSWHVGMQLRTNFVSNININNGGVYETFYIVNNFGAEWSWPEGSKQYVSFNGGIWRNPPNKASKHNFFYTSNADNRCSPDGFFCQKGGATFDTRNSHLVLNVPLTEPIGKVIKSVTLPVNSDFAAMTNIGPLRISFEGSGVGATAFAPFDDVEGRLAGTVTITSPGSGYGDDTVVKVHSHDGKKSWVCSYELEDASSGGLAKLGTGQLDLACENTYRGKTSVKAGTLKMTVAQAIPDGNALEVASGAKFSLMGDLSVTTLEGAGSVIGGNANTLAVTDSFVVGAENLAENAGLSVEGNLVFADNATICIADADLLASAPKKAVLATAANIMGNPSVSADFGGRWGVSKNAAGTKLTLRYIHGTTVVFR